MEIFKIEVDRAALTVSAFLDETNIQTFTFDLNAEPELSAAVVALRAAIVRRSAEKLMLWAQEATKQAAEGGA